MKYFAVTPDACTPATIAARLATLRSQNVSFLYLRSPLLYNEDITKLVSAVSSSGIVPILPCRFAEVLADFPVGLHIKSTEQHALPGLRGSQAALITVSCHTAADAVRMIENEVSYVFVSPVFPPLSKAGDARPLVPRQDIAALTARFGERIVLLGGMTHDRVRLLQEELPYDFSAAGISMFFGDAGATTC